MSIINIFIAIIVAIGFWRSSTKELDRKTANATFIKTAILCLLSAWTVFFYYKSYQVATFKNYVSVEGHKGMFEVDDDSYVLNGDTINTSHLYPKDVVKEIILTSRFSKKRIEYNDPITAVFDANSLSGFRSYCLFSNHEGEVSKIYPKVDTLQIIIDNPRIKHLYDISLYSNTVPSIFPFSFYEEHYSEGVLSNTLGNSAVSVSSSTSHLSNPNLKIGSDYDQRFLSRFITYEDIKYPERISLYSTTQSQTINTLNFFSGADLSQCIYEVAIDSDIPVESLGMYFDIPIEVSSLAVDRSQTGSRHFVINDLQRIDGKVHDFKYFHIKFPTLANLQLIRSLILTTIMTALLSLTAANFFYYGRNRYKRYSRKHTFSLEYKKKMLLLWIPLGKIIVWSLFVIFAYLLFKSCAHKYFIIRLWNAEYSVILMLLFFAIYVLLLAIVLSVLYVKGITLSDILDKSKSLLKNITGKLHFKKRR